MCAMVGAAGDGGGAWWGPGSSLARMPQELVYSTLRQMSVSLGLGVFIGAATVTGCAVGVAAAYVANEAVLRRLRQRAEHWLGEAREAALRTREGKALAKAWTRGVEQAERLGDAEGHAAPLEGRAQQRAQVTAQGQAATAQGQAAVSLSSGELLERAAALRAQLAKLEERLAVAEAAAASTAAKAEQVVEAPGSHTGDGSFAARLEALEQRDSRHESDAARRTLHLLSRVAALEGKTAAIFKKAARN